MGTSPNVAEISSSYRFAIHTEPRPERGASLRDQVMDLQLLADTVEALGEEDLSPELREDFEQDLLRAISGTREKVDRTGDTLGFFASAQAAATQEIQRLEARRDHFARAQARLENYVLRVIECSKFAKLEGYITTLSARKNPPSVAIAAGAVLPEQFMRQPAVPAPVPDKTAIKAALKAGAEIEGATLVQTVKLVRS